MFQASLCLCSITDEALRCMRMFCVHTHTSCCPMTLYMVAGKTVAGKKSRKGAAAGAAEPESEQALISNGHDPPQSAAAADGMLAWQGLGLDSRVVAAIGTLGFEEPTPIQRECMLPAIRDRRDIIGAAQTVASSHSKYP